MRSSWWVLCVASILLLTGCRMGGNRLIVGDIEGARLLDESSSGEYSVNAAGDTGITYLWAVKPSSAGSFSDQASATTVFHPSEVDSHTTVSVRVVVNSDRDGPVVRMLDVTIIDSVPAFVNDWAATWGGEGEDRAYGMAVDDLGGVYVTGSFEGTLDFDPRPTEEVRTSNGGRDAFLVKYSSSAEFFWARTWGGSGSDCGRAVAVDDFGNVYVTGDFETTVDFDPGPGTDEHSSNASSDVFLSRFYSTGEFHWARTWGGSSFTDHGFGLAVDGSDYVYITGCFSGAVDFDPGPDTDEHSVRYGWGAFLSKFDAGGAFEWVRTWGGGYHGDHGFGVAVDGLGSVYVTGDFWGGVDFDPGPTIKGRTSVGWADVFLSKFDSAGEFQWVRTWGGPGGFYWEAGFDVAADEFGNVYVTGCFEDRVDFDPSMGIDEHTSNGAEDAFLSKFDSYGEFLWARTWGGCSYGDQGLGIALDAWGDVHITGSFCDAVDFDPGPGTFSSRSRGYLDAFLSKLDSSGDFQWARTWGGSEGDGDIATATAVDGLGCVLAVGQFSGVVDFHPLLAGGAYISQGGKDAFLVKFSRDAGSVLP